jgi:hypothetical protein
MRCVAPEYNAVRLTACDTKNHPVPSKSFCACRRRYAIACRCALILPPQQMNDLILPALCLPSIVGGARRELGCTAASRFILAA